MINLDELLTGAADRLDDATANLTIPDAPRPQMPVGRIVAVAACLVALVGAAVVVRSREHHREPQAPPGLLEGRFGSKITMTEVPDGDNDPQTWKVVASPAGGTVSVVRESTTVTTAAVAATTPDGRTGDTVPADGGGGELCLAGSFVGGGCPPDLATLVLTTSSRNDTEGQALVSGVPADAYAVTFRAGATRYWARPVHGVVVFPYPVTADALSTATAIADDGTILATATQHDATLTNAEVTAAATTQATGETIPGGWFTTAEATHANVAAIVTRLQGRSGQIGFGGPFTSQSFVVNPENTLWLQVITVRSADVDEVTAQLDSGHRGSVRRTVAEPDGLTVLLWADNDVTDATIDAAAGALTQTNPTPDYTRSLDGPHAFTGSQPVGAAGIPGLWALLSQPLDAPAGQVVRIEGDDLGNLMVTRFGDETGSNSYTSINIAANSAPTALPQAGAPLDNMIVVPSDVHDLRLTLDDGSTVTLNLVDLQPYADAKVAFTSDDPGAHQISKVHVNEGS